MSEQKRAFPSLNALRAFEAAGRSLNFRVAAEELGVTQGAVAQQVRGLEAYLGLRLFDRRHRGLALTDAGRTYHQQVAKAFELLHDATAALRPRPSRVTLSVTPTFASKWLIPRLANFTTAHPTIDLRILATESVLSFHSDGIDLAVRQGRPPFGASLDADLLFRQDVIAVCIPSLLPAGAVSAGDRALSDLALLHDTHNLWPAFLESVVGRAGTDSARGLRFNQTTLSIEAALAGQGIALASRFLIANDLAAGRLTQAIPGVLEGGRDFYLLAKRKPRRTQAADTVRNWLVERRDHDTRSFESRAVSTLPSDRDDDRG